MGPALCQGMYTDRSSFLLGESGRNFLPHGAGRISPIEQDIDVQCIDLMRFGISAKETHGPAIAPCCKSETT